MNRTWMLLVTAGLLALAAVVVGLPEQKDTSHTVARPDEVPGAGVVLTPVSAKDGVLSLEGKLSGAWLMAGPSRAVASTATSRTRSGWRRSSGASWSRRRARWRARWSCGWSCPRVCWTSRSWA